MSSSSTTNKPQPPLKPPQLLLLTIDKTLSHFLHTITKAHLPISLLYLLELSADFRFCFPITISLLLAPHLSPLHRPFFYPFLIGLLLDLPLVGLIKIIFRRSRPHYNPNMSPAVHADHFSFPSGHASRVSFVAAFVSLSKDRVFTTTHFSFSPVLDRWIVVGVCVWAVATSVSRILLGRHFVLDVVAGVCLGVVEAVFVFRFFKF